MNDIISLTIATVVLAVCVSAYYRSRYWARRAEVAAVSAKAAVKRAKASAEEASRIARKDQA